MLFQLDEATVVTLSEEVCSSIRENMKKHCTPESKQLIEATGEAPYLCVAADTIEAHCKYLTIVGVSKILDHFRNDR